MVKGVRFKWTPPDLRGEFRRSADKGRGIDPGRQIGTQQGDAIRNITGQFSPNNGAKRGNLRISSSGALVATEVGSGHQSGSTEQTSWQLDFDASRVVPTAHEVRPRSIAYPTHIYAGTPA